MAREKVIRQCNNLGRMITKKRSEIASLESQLRTRQALLAKQKDAAQNENSDRHDIQSARRNIAALESDIREIEAKLRVRIEELGALIYNFRIFGLRLSCVLVICPQRSLHGRKSNRCVAIRESQHTSGVKSVIKPFLPFSINCSTLDRIAGLAA